MTRSPTAPRFWRSPVTPITILAARTTSKMSISLNFLWMLPNSTNASWGLLTSIMSSTPPLKLLSCVVGSATSPSPKIFRNGLPVTKSAPALTCRSTARIYSPLFTLCPTRKLIEAAGEIINRGSKVAILIGQGCLGAREEILELAEKAGAPIIKALLGKAVVPDDSPYTTGGIGLLGTAPSQDALQDCDTLIIAGSSMPYVEFYPKPGKAKAVQIDIDPSRIGLRHP